MPTFPRTEAGIVTLAENMVTGLNIHAADFPSVNGATLAELLDNFKSLRGLQEEAKSQSQIATVTKDEELAALVELIKNDLKLAEVDTAADPEKLTEIGWGPRQQPQPVALPGQPENFVPAAEGPGDIWLKWDSPGEGGIIRNYIIERREEPSGGGTFGEWAVIGTSLNNEVHLLEQPRGIQMEYRVKAANVSGEGMPSNIAAVVL
jgi:hypothetical protein